MPPPPGAAPAQPDPNAGGAAGHYGAPVDMRSVHRAPPGVAPAALATFPRRVSAAVLSNLVFLAAATPVLWAIVWLARFVDRHTASCTVGSVIVVCESSGWALVAGTVAAAVATTIVSYLVFARSIDVHRGTVGMRQLGLQVRTAGGHGAPTRSDARAHWFGSSILQSVSGLVVGLIWFDLATPWRVATVLVVGLVAVGTIAGALASLVGRRTVWDRWSGLEVIIDREPAWTAIAAAAIGSIVPTVAVGTLVLADFDDLQDWYRELTAANADTGDQLVVIVPIALLTVTTIVLGHVGNRATRWRVDHPAGDGAARTGTALGWAAPVVIALAAVATVTADRVESLNARGCDDGRARIVEALDSFLTLNGAPPTSLGELAHPVYLGEAPAPERWRYSTDPTAAKGFRLVGIGDCAD